MAGGGRMTRGRGGNSGRGSSSSSSCWLANDGGSRPGEQAHKSRSTHNQRLHRCARLEPSRSIVGKGPPLTCRPSVPS